MKRFTLALTFAFAAAAAFGQAPPAPKNLQVLPKDIPNPQLIRTMQFMSASLGVTCDYCHVRTDGKLEPADDAKDTKKTARQMIQLVMDTNEKFFKGNVEVSCETCHRGASNPVSVPVLPIALPKEEPAATATRPPQPAREEIVSRYAAALGKVDTGALERVEMKGMRETPQGTAPFVVVTAPGKFYGSMTTPQGQFENAVNGATGWIRDAKGTRAMQPGQVETATQIAEAYRPALPSDIPEKAFTHRLTVDGKEYDVVIYRTSPMSRTRLYFDPATGLLAKRINLTQSAVGMIPQETDFSDYREVNGMKMPFVVTVYTIDPRAGATRRYSEITLNAKVNEKQFEEPK